MDTGLELLLKYRPALLAQGRLAFDQRPAVLWGLAALALVVVGLVLWTYRAPPRTAAPGAPARRPLLAALRAVAVALVIVCLMRPVLVLDAAVPRRNTVVVLVDDSRSMRVADWDDAGTTGAAGRVRADFARAAFAPGAPLQRALSDQFTVRLYRFSDVLARADSLSALAAAGDRTRLGAALDGVREELDGVPLAGVVVVSDGADGAPAALADAATAMRARGTPVFTVGVGTETVRQDVEVRSASAPGVALAGSTVAVDVAIAARDVGAGDSLPVLVEENGRILARKMVPLAGAQTVAAREGTLAVRIPVSLPDAGLRALTVRVPAQPGERVVENNSRALTIDVRGGVRRVLYFEGEPRFEAKFLRRAVADDKALRVALLQRTALGKYLRLGVEDSLDLLGGFPTSRSVLFRYDALILGSIEASAFTAEQLRMIADFVRVRGGSLVLLGGRHALAEGGYAGTALEEAIPVVLERNQAPGLEAGDVAAPAVGVRLTPAGIAHLPLQLAADERASLERWRTLPPLTAVNVARRVRPGATVLLDGSARDARDSTRRGAPTDSRVVLAYQRYGRGKVVAFPVQDTWTWQMDASIPLEDMTHELLWRQMLRWLTTDVPGRVEVATSNERPAPGDPVELRATVRDSHFVATNGASVVARVTSPTGAARDVPLQWSVSGDGEYRGTFVPDEEGTYEVNVVRGGVPTGAAPAAPNGAAPDASADTTTVRVEAARSREEYFASAMRRPLLEQLARQTGGRFYTPATVSTLPEDLRYARGGVTVTERKDLWDMPVTYLLIGGLLAAEWALRRRAGLA